MNQDLQKTLSTYLDTLLSTLKEGAAFASDQIPLVIQEKLHWDLAQASIGIGLGLLLVALATWLSLTAKAWNEKDHYSDWGFLVMAAAGCAVIGLPMIIINLLTFVQIEVAPRLYILEWVQSMLTKH